MPTPTAHTRHCATLALVTVCFVSAAPAPARPQSSAPSNVAPASSSAPDSTKPSDNSSATKKPASASTAVTKNQSTTSASAQKKQPVHAKSQTVVVSARLTPEEKEDQLLNTHTAYAFGEASDTNCQKILDTYQTDLIPAAEKAQFPKNKAKYLYIGHRSMAECQMHQGRYVEAEQSYSDALAQADVWPGKNDSAYPAIWRDLGIVQMARNHWKDAQANLTKAADLYQERIDAQAKAVDSAVKDAVVNVSPKSRELIAGEAREEAQYAIDHLVQRRAEVLAFSGACYLREGDLDSAAKTIEQAYQEALAGKLQGVMRDNIIEVGTRVADLSGDTAEQAKWAARADTSAKP